MAMIPWRKVCRTTFIGLLFTKEYLTILCWLELPMCSRPPRRIWYCSHQMSRCYLYLVFYAESVSLYTLLTCIRRIFVMQLNSKRYCKNSYTHLVNRSFFHMTPIYKLRCGSFDTFSRYIFQALWFLHVYAEILCRNIAFCTANSEF